MTIKRQRLIGSLLLCLAFLVGYYIQSHQAPLVEAPAPDISPNSITSSNQTELQKYPTAQQALGALAVKGRSPKTGYTRSLFGDGWQQRGSCDVRNQILSRDLESVNYQIDSCTVVSGQLNDPYSGKRVSFVRGSNTSQAVQIDHVVALSDAWQKGAQQLSAQLRTQFANDPMNLLAVDGPANMNKGDGDAATWLPANKSFRCQYVARQISVKITYSLWVTLAEKDAMTNVLKSCPTQKLVT